MITIFRALSLCKKTRLFHMTLENFSLDSPRDNKELHAACRSLLQKAVRRGNVSLVKQAVSRLYDIGDAAWLSKRTAVITFEECWPLGTELGLVTDKLSPVEVLARISRSVKWKDATGLGSLALALSSGDYSVLSGKPEDHQILLVSEGIKRPKDFWNWINTNVTNKQQRALVNAAQTSFQRGGWPWDKAFMQAAAYLTVTQGIPDVCSIQEESSEFLFWVALDKHTPQGKRGLYEAARRLSVSPYQLFWVSFYLESAHTNESNNSRWWFKEVQWRLRQVELDDQSASLLWDKARPLVSKILEADAEALQQYVYLPDEQQLELFSEANYLDTSKLLASAEGKTVKYDRSGQNESAGSKQTQLHLFPQAE